MQTLSVENLPAGTTVPDLAALFRPFGWVAHVDLRAGGAGEVDLAWGGGSAAEALNGAEFRGRVLAVRTAQAGFGPPTAKSPTRWLGDF